VVLPTLSTFGRPPRPRLDRSRPDPAQRKVAFVYGAGMLSRLLLAAASRTPRRLHPFLRRIPGVDRIRPSGYANVPIRYGPLAGARLRLNLATERGLALGSWEPAVQRALARLVQKDMVCWDIGAHIGFFTVLIGRRCRHVLAVEAHPDNARRVRENCALNQLSSTVVSAAVWSEPGELELRLGPETGVHKAVAVGGRVWDQDHGTLVVPATTLDLLGDEHGFPDLVKLDVERAERHVLAGADRVLAHAQVMLIETHSRELREEVAAVLAGRGFVVDGIDDDHVVGIRPELRGSSGVRREQLGVDQALRRR
jgi:FkbM family methyltransferase